MKSIRLLPIDAQIITSFLFDILCIEVMLHSLAFWTATPRIQLHENITRKYYFIYGQELCLKLLNIRQSSYYECMHGATTGFITIGLRVPLASCLGLILSKKVEYQIALRGWFGMF